MGGTITERMRVDANGKVAIGTTNVLGARLGVVTSTDGEGAVLGQSTFGRGVEGQSGTALSARVR